MVHDVLKSFGTRSTRRQDGFFFTDRQFVKLIAWIIAATLTTQVAINLFAFESFIGRKVAAAVAAHNVDATSHVLSLLDQAQDEKLLEGRLVKIETRLKNIEDGVKALSEAHENDRGRR